jgi:hypothetical protein
MSSSCRKCTETFMCDKCLILSLSCEIQNQSKNIKEFRCEQCFCNVELPCDFLGLCGDCVIEQNKQNFLTGSTLTEKMVIKLTLDYYAGKCSKLIRCDVESSSHKIQKELETMVCTFAPQPSFIRYK